MWTLPDGSTVDPYRKLGTNYWANIALDANTAGAYTLTVVEVTKAGHTFDPDSSNLLTGLVDIAP